MMSMTRCRRVTAIAVLFSMFFTQACATYSRARGTPSPGSRIRVTAKGGLPVYEGVLATGAATCRATNIDGTVQSSRGDTLTVLAVKRLTDGARAASCSAANGVTIVAPLDIADVRVRHISATRTTFLILGLALVAVAATAGTDKGCAECPGGF